MEQDAKRRRRFVRAAVAAAAVVMVAVPAGGSAADAAKRTPTRAQTIKASRKVVRASQVKWRPKRGAKSVHVLVGLKSEPATLAARQEQAKVAAATAPEGVHITRRFARAVNGFAATTDAAGVDALWARPEVLSVEPVRAVHTDNANSNLFTRTAQAWTALGVTGAGQRIAVIDTGIDYTHADLGGSGDPADFTNNDGTVIEPGTFPTAKVVAGYDFVGDAYDFVGDGSPTDTPVPDPDPIDCEGHGSHVSGTAAGNGVLADGTAYRGPYTQAAVDAQKFTIAPGSAPQASLMAYRVFGCDGAASTEVIVAAIDRAVADGATVINMSLGSTYGRSTDLDSQAVDNAMLAGTMVVTAAGNEGASPYMVGGPAVATRGLSIGAVDAEPSFPGGLIDPIGANLTAINANGSTALPLTAKLHVVPDGAGGISAGCSAAEFDAATAGTIAVVVRGVCARADKPTFAEGAGAVATIMVNNAPGLPPYEGQIPGVSKPFFGVDPSDSDAVAALDGKSITLVSAGVITNPSYSQAASFSSAGPRSVDGAFKPEVSAPGVGVFSALVGSGTDAASSSGTSMATPHSAGIAALVRQAHPGWAPRLIKAAMVNTAQSGVISLFDPRQSGNGALVAPEAVRTRQALLGPDGDVAANFYFHELNGGYDSTATMSLYNGDRSSRTYRLSRAFDPTSASGAVVTVSPSTVTVPAGATVKFSARLQISRAAVKALPIDYDGGLTTINGRINATPTNGGSRLSAPFLFVPRPRSEVNSVRRGDVINVGNSGLIDGTADVYSWLLSDAADPASITDARALGVQYLDDGSGSSDPLVVLAINLRSRLSNPAEGVYDIFLDVDHDGAPDYELLGADEGLILADDPNGFLGSFVFNLATGDGVEYLATAPTDGSIVELPFYASDLGIDAKTGPVELVASLSDLGEGTIGDDFEGSATIDPFHPQTSTGDYEVLAPGTSTGIPVARRAPAAGESRALGWMVVTVDDRAGSRQADLIG